MNRKKIIAVFSNFILILAIFFLNAANGSSSLVHFHSWNFNPCGFGLTLSFYSRTNGSWSTPSTWSNSGHGGAPATTVPGASDLVFIGDGVDYYHTVTVTAGTALSSSLSLQQGSVLDLGCTTGNNFGTITSGSAGKLRISANSGTAVFPAGNFSAFLSSSGGTVEYYTTGSQDFTLPTITAAPTSAVITSYCFLQLLPGTGRAIKMPNSNLTIYRNMIVLGTSATGKVKLNNEDPSALTILGHLNITSGNLLFQNMNNKPLTMVVDSNITVATGALFNLETTGPGADNTLSIGGNLINNGIFDMSFSQAQRAYPVTFTGSADASISGTGTVTDFYALTVNKGTTSSSVLNVVSSAFSFSNNTDPLILLNGTFRLTSGVTVTASENSLIIPATASLSANGGSVLVSTSSLDNADVRLGGTLEVKAGEITIGNITNNVNNDIVYDSVGLPTIDIQGGSLFVNGQIRRSAVNGSGSLIYKQAGSGVVTINGRNQLPAKAKLEILNAGSVFNMSDGILTIVRGAGTTFNDLYLDPFSSNVTGGTVVFGNGSTETSGQANVFTVNTDVPLNNFTIDGTTNPKTVSLAVNGLTLKGNLLINESSIFNANTQAVNIAGNWTNEGTFNHYSGTVNFNGSSTINGSSTTTFNNLGISAGKTLTAKLDGNVNLQGNWINDGIFNHNNGTIIFNGTTQTLGGTSTALFNNVTIASGTTSITTSGQTLRGILLCNGTLNADGNLKLISSATQTALIDGAGTGEVQGSITLQRYLASGFGYKYFSSPFQSATVGQFAGYVNLAASFPTFYRYDENKVNNGWVNYTNSAGLLTPGYGYAANFGASLPAITIELSGVVNNNVVAPSTLYNHNNTFTLGFNLMGNPYPSPIDWNAATGWTRTNIDNALYYFNAGNTNQYTGTYSTYINGVSSDGIADNIIPAMQGFFIHVSDGTYPVSGTLIFNNGIRINNLSASFHKNVQEDTISLLRLAAGFSNEQEYFDHTVIYFDPAATKEFDKNTDAFKLMNTDTLVPNIYSFSSDAARLSINAMPISGDSVNIIPLGIRTESDGWILIKSVDIIRMPEGLLIYLNDKKTGMYYNLLSDPEYGVYLEAGQHENRFFIIFSLKKLQYAPDTNIIFNAFSFGNKLFVYRNMDTEAMSELIIYNMLGQVILRQNIFENGKHELVMNVDEGIYFVTLRTKEGVPSKKIYLTGNR